MSGFVLGVVASFIAWLVVAALLRPRLSWEPTLRAIGSNDAPWFYVYLRNRRPWHAFDINVEARLRVRGLYKDRPARWATFDLPLDDPHIPVIRGTLRSHRTNVSRLRTIFTGGARQGFRVLCHPSALPDRLRHELSDDSCSLTDLLALGQEAELYFVVTATDGFSGTRGVSVSNHFQRSDLMAVLTASARSEPHLRGEEPVGISSNHLQRAGQVSRSD
jgi:hypothetical protein